MHILIMITFVIVGWALGQNVSWWFGAPLIALGVYFFEFGGKRFANFRFIQENLFALVGLFSIFVVVVGNILGL